MARTVKIIGVCVFRNEGDGCFTSKWMNEGEGPLVEACKKTKGADSDFIGEYKTVWLEGSTHEYGSLKIDYLRDRQRGYYKLLWKNDEEVVIFEGIGMLYDGLLVATYWGN